MTSSILAFPSALCRPNPLATRRSIPIVMPPRPASRRRQALVCVRAMSESPKGRHESTNETTTSASSSTSAASIEDVDLPFTTSLFVHLLPGILRFAPSLLMPTTAALGVVGALHGADAVHKVVELAPPQLLDALPYSLAATVAAFYNDSWHGAAVDVGIDTAASLAAVLFAFVVLPLGDLVFGNEPEGEMAMPPSPSSSSLFFSSSSLSSSSPSSSPSSPSSSSSEHNETESKVKKGNRGKDQATTTNPYRLWLYAYALCHLSALAAAAAAAPSMHHPLPLVGAALSLGVSGANAFTCGHELGHSRSRRERALADALFAAQLVPYWRTAHAAHHRNVGLREDPDTARLGESYWQFLPRSLKGELEDALELDASKTRKNSSSVPRWVASAAAAALLAAWLGDGVPGLSLFVIQAATAVLFLQAVEFIEHYGLTRSSPTERVQPHHSWNANHALTNAVTFRLQRHSDHHAHPEKSFELLVNERPERAPQLPASYPVMMVTAMVFPGLFRRIMDPRAREEGLKAEARRRETKKEMGEKKRGGGGGGGGGGVVV